jgi:hypothetical protein
MTEPPVDFLAMRPGNGNELVADVGTVFTDAIHAIEGDGVGAVNADESFGGQSGGDISQRQVDDIGFGPGDEPHIVAETFNIE